MKKPITKAELARQLGVSRTHITLLTQGKRKLSERLADKLADVLAGKPNSLSVASTPLGGVSSVFGGFDSHALPPQLFNFFIIALLLLVFIFITVNRHNRMGYRGYL